MNCRHRIGRASKKPWRLRRIIAIETNSGDGDIVSTDQVNHKGAMALCGPAKQ
jgi:hypothetical protein